MPFLYLVARLQIASAALSSKHSNAVAVFWLEIVTYAYKHSTQHWIPY